MFTSTRLVRVILEYGGYAVLEYSMCLSLEAKAQDTRDRRRERSQSRV